MACVFCGGDGKLSREHVFARWLVPLFPDLGHTEYVRRFVTSTDDARHERPGPPFDVVVRDVCAACNNNWMAALEAEAQPILTPMVLDRTRILTAPEQRSRDVGHEDHADPPGRQHRERTIREC